MLIDDLFLAKIIYLSTLKHDVMYGLPTVIFVIVKLTLINANDFTARVTVLSKHAVEAG